MEDQKQLCAPAPVQTNLPNGPNNHLATPSKLQLSSHSTQQRRDEELLSPCVEGASNLEDSQLIDTIAQQPHSGRSNVSAKNGTSTHEITSGENELHAATESYGVRIMIEANSSDEENKTSSQLQLSKPGGRLLDLSHKSHYSQGLRSSSQKGGDSGAEVAVAPVEPTSSSHIGQPQQEEQNVAANESSHSDESNIFDNGDTSSDDNDFVKNPHQYSVGTPPKAQNAPDQNDKAILLDESGKPLPNQGDPKQATKDGQPSSGLLPKNELKPMPLIKSGISIAADMRFGWRPQEKEVHGAPIPLHYDFGPLQIPINPLTNRTFPALFRGHRIPTSIDVHKKFANIANLTPDECPDPRPKGKAQEPYPTYIFKVPMKFPKMLPHSFDESPPFTGMNPKIKHENDELIFDSNFESGNLDMVIKTKPLNYDLYMRVDTNTRGHHQWFYFSIETPKTFEHQTVTFRVVNFTKPQSLYTSGMRICCARKSQHYQWGRVGTNIKYGRSHLIRRHSNDPAKVINYSMLTFNFDFGKVKEKEKIFFSYCFPYSFTMLHSFLREVNLAEKETDIMKESVLCTSLSGIEVPLITITSRLRSDPKHYNMIRLSEFEDDDSKLSLPMYKKKKYVIVGARVHPGESNSSYMMQGFIKYLLGDSHQAKQLRKRVVFKIVPMINVDGVIIGNYRTSMSGNDLNRRYVKPDFRIHPVVCAIKQLASDLIYGVDEESQKKEEGPITLNEDILAFIDMHGHSRKKNVFIYGPQEPLHSEKYLKMRIIPKLLAEETAKFRYHSCRFRLEQSKLKAARIVMWREFNIMNCFTFEASFHGHFDQQNNNYEFTPSSFEEMGEHLTNSFFEYLMIMEEEERRRKLKEIQKKRKKKQKQFAMQRSTTLGRDGNQSNPTSSFGHAIAKNNDGGQALGNHLNLPPSGKSGKKGQSGSSSSRARNISHVTNRDSDKETKKQKKSTVESQSRQKEKRKTIVKKESGSSLNIGMSRNGTLTMDQIPQTAANKKAIQNPNEPPQTTETNQSAGSEADLSNIQVGSRDLRASNNQVQNFANAQLDQDEEELLRQSENSRTNQRHGFRNLKDMFEAVRVQEQQKKKRDIENTAEAQVEESEAGSDCASEVSDDPADQIAAADEELEDELSKEQQRKLHTDILDAITSFVKVNNFQEHEYFGVSKQTLKKQKKIKAAQYAAQIMKEKEAKSNAESAVKEKPEKTKKNKQKRQSTQKDTMLGAASGNTTVNYQSNTLSVAQKRRSFNADQVGTGKQVITNEQLNQQLAHQMGYQKIRAGLSSPLYYHLHQSTSNFSNYYVYRFEQRDRAPQPGQLPSQLMQVNSLQQPVLDQVSLTQQQQNELDGMKFSQATQQPQMNQAFFAQQQLLQQQQMQRIQQALQQQNSSGTSSGGKSIADTGRQYQTTQGSGSGGKEHYLQAKQMSPAYPVSSGGGSAGISGNGPGAGGSFGAFGYRKSHTKDESQKSIKELGQKNGGPLIQGQLPADKGAQYEMLRQSQQQTVQPMIFNFFNSKNEVKQRNHNREQKGSDRGVIHNVYQSNHGAGQMRGTVNQHAHSQDYRNQKQQAVSEIRRATQILQRKQDVQESSYMTSGRVTSYTKDGLMGKTPTRKQGMQAGAAAGSQRYPPINQSTYNKTNLKQSSGIQSHQVTQQYATSKNVNSQKSKSSFNSQKPFLQQSDPLGGGGGTSSGLQSPPSAVKSQQQTKSTKFANIEAQAEIMKTQTDLSTLGAPPPKQMPLTTQKQQSDALHSINNGLVVNTLKIASNSGSNGISQTRTNYHQRVNTIGSSHDHHLSQTQKNQQVAVPLGISSNNTDQLLDTNEFKRNAIRQIHPLKSYNQVQGEGVPPLTSLGMNKVTVGPGAGTSEFEPNKFMSVTQDQFRPSNGGNNMRHISQHNHQSSTLATGNITGIDVGQLYTAGVSPRRSGADHYDHHAVKKKANAINSSHHQWHLDPNQSDERQGVSGSFIDTTQPVESSKLGTYPYQLVTTGHSMSNIGGYIQGSAIKDFCAGGAVIQSQGNNYSWYGGGSLRQPPSKTPFHQHDSSSEKLNTEVSKKLSQFSVSATPVEDSSKITMNQRRQRDGGQRLTNDHSQLRRSGDYQSKIHKQISLDPVSQQLLTNKHQASTEVMICADPNVIISSSGTTSDSKASVAAGGGMTKFGVRVPPDLYQKNPYQPQFQVNKQQILPQSQKVSIDSKLGDSSVKQNHFAEEEKAQVALRSQSKPITRTDSLQPQMYHHEARALHISSNGANGPSQGHRKYQNQRSHGLGRGANDPQTTHHQTAQDSFFHTHTQQQQSQGSKGIGAPSQALQQLPSFIKSNNDMTSTMTGGGLTTQQSPQSQGIQNIFADPNYGIGKVYHQQQQDSMSGSKNVATVGSSHLHSPREEIKIMGYEETQAIRDMKALWLKNTAMSQGTSVSNNVNSENAAFNGLLETTNSSGKSIPNSSIIRIQKSKYQGLIKQRGVPIPFQMLAGQDITVDNLNENGFSSPSRQAAIQQLNKLNQQRQGLLQQQSFKRVSSGNKRGAAAGGGESNSNRSNYETRISGATELLASDPTSHLQQKQNSSFQLQPKRLNSVKRNNNGAAGSGAGGLEQMVQSSLGSRQESPKVKSGSGTKALHADAVASMSTTKRGEHIHHALQRAGAESSSSKSKGAAAAKRSELYRTPSGGQGAGSTSSGKKQNASRSRGKASSSKGPTATAKTQPLSRADLAD